MNTFFPLSIKEIIRETEKAVSLSFTVPEDLKSIFSFKAGQYITIKSEVNGKEIRRAYSLCSHPESDDLKVTVKEVEGGKFSAIVNNELMVGDVLQVHPPEGKFTFEASGEKKGQTYVGFAAGSGITPILSILKTVLDENPGNKFYLVFGNRTIEETIFFQELLDLQVRYPNRLLLDFIFSRDREEGYQFGRIDATSVEVVLDKLAKKQECEKFYLCGPEAMIHVVKDVLLKNNIEEERIAYELFISSEEGDVRSEIDGLTEVTVLLDDQEITFSMNTSATVMEAALDMEIDLPYSCQGGTCSSCVAKIKEGEATMKKNMILAEDEVEEGLVLTCQAIPNTRSLVLDYDDV